MDLEQRNYNMWRSVALCDCVVEMEFAVFTAKKNIELRCNFSSTSVN